jgi:RNA polymerase sigma-70 factor (ECF subfamily)
MTAIKSDIDLVTAFAQGDLQAAGTLSERLAPKLLRFATRLLSDMAEAEDVVQETMLRLWRSAPDWREGQTHVQAWCYRVARNLCLDRLRKRRSVGLDEIADPASDAPGADETLLAAERKQGLEAALAQLPDRQRDAVVLRHIEGLSNPEIAAVLEVSVEAVESLTARGKRALAKLLMPQKEELGL